MARLRMTTPGEWFEVPLVGVPQADRPRLKIRPVPTAKRKQLLWEIQGKTQKVRTRRVEEEGGESYLVAERDLNSFEQAEFSLRLAVEALVDAEQLEIEAGNEAARELLGAGAVGDYVVVDGKLQASELKRLILDDVPWPKIQDANSITEFVMDRSDDAARVVAAEEDAAGKT